MADRTSNADRFTRPTTAHHLGYSNRHQCFEANYALSGLNAEDMGRQYREVRGQLPKGVGRNRSHRRGTVKQGTRRVKQRNGLDEPLWGQT